MSDKIDNPTKDELIEVFLDAAIESFTNWIVDATNVIRNINRYDMTANMKIQSAIFLIEKQLEEIDESITLLKNHIRRIYILYKKLEKEYEIEIFSVEYFSKFSKQMGELSSIVDSIKLVANRYNGLLELYKNQEVDINKYVTPSNQKSIEFLQTLDDKQLFEILEKGQLSGI
jgi:DNA repair exonuclease SbcCD ATPase subunit